MTGTGELLHPARARYCTVQCSTVYGVLFCTAQHRTPSSWTQSEVCCRQSNNWSGRVEHSELVASTGTASPAVSSRGTEAMYPKDTSGDDPGPAHTSEDRGGGGGGGGVQTESGLARRQSLFPAPGTASPSSSSSPGPSVASSDSPNNLNITVAPFTGGPFEVKVSKMDTVDELKKVIARRLKVSKERIYLLYRER